MPIRLSEFNRLSPEAAEQLLRPCLDIDRWAEALVDGRPYATQADLLFAASAVASPFTDDEVESALAHHPRIGERAGGTSTEANLSRSEQGGLHLTSTVQERLQRGNQAYEERFGRVFLIRAAGRDTAEILAALEQRLTNDPDTERRIVADQLREIAVLRLAQVVAP